MAAQNTIDLGRLALRPGEGRRLVVDLVTGELELGGQRYRLEPRPTPARVEISRTSSGHAMRLDFAGSIAGPCMRCLEPASIPIEVEAREIDQPTTDDEELRSPYVDEQKLDPAAWAHDALALELPVKILCRADCAGLCPVCGVTLNDAEPGDHDHPAAPDPRWAKLSELKLD
jgi:uncharacterized protein